MATPTPVYRHDGPLSATTADQVRALAHAVAEHDGVDAFGEQALLDLADPESHVVHLTAERHGGLAGYGVVDLRGPLASAELAVVPGSRRAGIGRALLAAARAVGDEQGLGPTLAWAHGDLTGARALAERAGLAVRRELWQMARELDGPVASPELPDGVRLRAYRPGVDDDAWLAVNGRAFDWHPEQGRLRASDLAARRAEPWFRAEDLVLAERDGRVVGFTWLKVTPGADEGELYVLGVDPDAQGLGLGRALTAVTLERLAGRGLRRVVLFTEGDNHAAVATYRRAGFDVVRRDVQYG